MKICLLSWGLWLIAAASLFAQSRVSVAPTYWYSYGQYRYQVHSVYDGSDTQAAGHDHASSVGLTARYHFSPKWDVSLGILYNRNSSRLSNPTFPQTDILFIRKYIQLPVLADYRLTNNRLSPYFSVGALFSKNQTVTTDPIKTSGVIGIGVDYRLNSSLSLLLQPTGTYLFYKPASDPLFQISGYSSYSFGVQTQLIWQIKRAN